MIEFIADCGHTIQLPDAEAGKIVKCAYCGREVQAPQREEQDPNFLLQDVDLNELAQEEGLSGTASMTIQGEQKKAKAAPTAEEIIETSTGVLRLLLMASFGAVCLVVLFVVFRSVLNIASEEGGPGQAGSQTSSDGAVDLGQLPDVTERGDIESRPAGPVAQGPEDPRPLPVEGSKGRIGHSFPPGTQGVFVETFSSAAAIHVRPGDLDHPRVLGADDAEMYGSGPQAVALPPGVYRLAVVYEVGSPELNSLPGFEDLRYDLDFDGDARAGEDFFARDRSTAMALIDDMEVGQRLARHYGVEILSGRWSLVTSLFVPGATLSEVLAYLPDVELYDFDDDHATRELAGRDVSPEDYPHILALLARAGQVVYEMPDGAHRVFEIDVQDGSVHSYEWVVEEATAEPEPELAQAPRAQPQQPSSGAGGPWNRSQTPVEEPEQQPAPRRAARPGPWNRVPGAAPVGQPPEDDLADIIAEFRQQLQADEKIPAEQWKSLLVGGRRHHLLQSADARTRTTFITLMDEPSVQTLLREVGDTMLSEPDIDVRLAWLEALVRSSSIDVLTIIDERRKAIGEDRSIDRDASQRELQALDEARRQIRAANRSGKSPWDR